MLIKIICILLPDINIQLCTNNLLYKELTEWWSEAAGLFQLLIIGACTDAAYLVLIQICKFLSTNANFLSNFKWSALSTFRGDFCSKNIRKTYIAGM